MQRALTSALAVTLVLAGCSDMGLDGTVPLEEAERMPPFELVAAVHGPTTDTTDVVIIDGRLWLPWGTPTRQDAGDLRAVGSSRGVTMLARSWDRSPYDALFVRDDGLWQGYAPVIGR